MIEHKLLKCLLSKEFYLRAKPKLLKEMFPGPLGALFETLGSAHDTYNTDSVSLTELAALHYVRNPAITAAARASLDIIFEQVAQEENINKDIAYDILEAVCLREKARQIGLAAVEVINGKTNTLIGVRNLVESFGDSSTTDSNVVPAPSELEDIIEGVASNVKWFFNIESLREIVPGIGPGLFSVIAMRPEAGKTTLHSFLTAGPGGFAEQGAKVDLIGNEEPVVRTKMRHVCARTGWTEAEIRNNIHGARELWNPIKENIRGFDAVGMTLEALDAHVSSSRPDVLIVDQLDKIHVSEKFNRSDEALRYIYTGAREIAKRHKLAFFGISQLSADAQGKRHPNFSMLENSKTGKAAEADLIICGGQGEGEGQEFLRYLNVEKNKISGRHQCAVVRIYPETSRYTV